MQAGRSRSPWPYLWVLLSLTVIALVPTVAFPLMLPRRDGAAEPPALAAALPAASPVAVVVATPAAPAPATTPAAASLPASAPPVPLAQPGVGVQGVPASSPPGLPSPAQPPPTQPPPTQPSSPALVIEAEAGTVRLSWAVVVDVAGASGGRAAQFTSSRGELHFRSLGVPSSGRYRITIDYAPGGEWSVRLRAGGQSAELTLGAGTGCCASLTAELRLSAGGSLRIEPSSGDGPMPAIDRILLELA